jgi:hypothetical protein
VTAVAQEDHGDGEAARLLLSPRFMTGLLVALVALDVALAALALLWPQTWFALFHDAPYVDPAGLLRRTGAGWAAFALVQAIAAWRWRASPVWLGVVAGVRWTELFTDWTYLAVAEHVTTAARVGLVAAPLHRRKRHSR